MDRDFSIGVKIDRIIWRQIKIEVLDKVWDQAWDPVDNQVWSRIYRQVGSQVRIQVWSQVRRING